MAIVLISTFLGWFIFSRVMLVLGRPIRLSWRHNRFDGTGSGRDVSFKRRWAHNLRVCAEVSYFYDVSKCYYAVCYDVSGNCYYRGTQIYYRPEDAKIEADRVSEAYILKINAKNVCD